MVFIKGTGANQRTGEMISTDTRIGFIGGGNMGEAFIGALTRSGAFKPSQVQVTDVFGERLNLLARTYGVKTHQDNAELYNSCNIVVLAVKPQDLERVLADIAERRNPASTDRRLIISIAAGFPIRKMEQLLYTGLDESQQAQLPIVRVMPNTPALVLSGMSGMSANSHANAQDKQQTVEILYNIGRVIEFEEKDLDAVTAMSGSGPAYLFFIVESMIAAGVNVGLSKEDSVELVLTTFEGALKLLRDSRDTPAQLRRNVTSPGGTTEAALGVLEKFQFKQAMIEAVAAAARRSEELGR